MFLSYMDVLSLSLPLFLKEIKEYPRVRIFKNLLIKKKCWEDFQFANKHTPPFIFHWTKQWNLNRMYEQLFEDSEKVLQVDPEFKASPICCEFTIFSLQYPPCLNSAQLETQKWALWYRRERYRRNPLVLAQGPKRELLKLRESGENPWGISLPNSHNPVLRSPEVGGRMGVAATAPPTGTGNGKPPGVKNLPLHSMEPFLQVGRSNLFLSFLFCLQESHSIKLFMNSWVHTQAV